jgi:four helix bundle suffix protein
MIMKQNDTKGFIPPHGGYRNLMSYVRAEIIYDATVRFTKRYFGKFDRTVDQMVQAARSGKQNIAEGSMASGTSKEMEIKLTNVARASLEELLLDYEDFLRSRDLPVWEKNHRLVVRFRELNRTPQPKYETFRRAFEHPDAEICANAIACLIRITTYLLKKQLDTLEKVFVSEGGIKERMLFARVAARKYQ